MQVISMFVMSFLFNYSVVLAQKNQYGFLFYSNYSSIQWNSINPNTPKTTLREKEKKSVGRGFTLYLFYKENNIMDKLNCYTSN